MKLKSLTDLRLVKRQIDEARAIAHAAAEQARQDALRRAQEARWFAHAVWMVPLPIFAVVGGLMLFAHSHGDHPAADKIALHHALMGTMAITAGSSKLISGWRQRQLATERSYWELLWAGLVLVIGVQLLFYSE